MYWVKKRFAEQSANATGMYENRKINTDWNNHTKSIIERQNQLRKAIKRAVAADCKEYNKEADYWVNKAPPTKPDSYYK